MAVHPDKTAERAVDSCGGTYTPEQKASGYADGHFEALDAAMMAVRPVDALTAELLAVLSEVESRLRPRSGRSRNAGLHALVSAAIANVTNQ